MTSLPALTVPVLAHSGAPVAPHDLLGAWSADPGVVAVLAVGAWLYERGRRALHGGPAGNRALPRWRVACFRAAVATAAVALLSPLDAAAEALFAAHMLQHLLLTLLLPPLLVLGRPVLVASMGLRATTRRSVLAARMPLQPRHRAAFGWALLAVLAHTVTLWMWHLPALYEAALGAPVLHAAEHATLVAGAVPFWWLVADARGRHADAGGVVAIFGGVLQSGALAAAITFSGGAWYTAHAASAGAWGLTALEDQHVAGGLMWFPGGAAYIAGGALLFARWLTADARRVGDTDVVGPGPGHVG